MYDTDIRLGDQNLSGRLDAADTFRNLDSTIAEIAYHGEAELLLVALKKHSAMIEAEIEERKARRKMNYREYLKTEHWQNCRDEMLCLSNHRCFLCNAPSHETQLQVHHKSYERLGNEHIMDLIVLCADCHAKFHDKLPKPQDVVPESDLLHRLQNGTPPRKN